MPKDPYRELRDAIEIAVLRSGRNRAQRRRLRPLIRDQLAEQLKVARAESRRLRSAAKTRCGAKTRRGTCCVRPALAHPIEHEAADGVRRALDHNHRL